MGDRPEPRRSEAEASEGIERNYSLILVASVPPPIAGQSIATEILLDAVRSAGIEHRVVDLSRDFYTGKRSWERTRRLLEVAQLPARVAMAGRALKGRPVILYLQLGQSAQAMARDVPILALGHAMRWPVVVHVHGGGFRHAFDRAPAALQAALRSLLAPVAHAIVLSPSLEAMFDGLVPPERVVSIANGVPREVTERARKVTRTSPHDPPTVLYLGNLIESKGYDVVLEAARLAEEQDRPYRFVIAGAVTEETTIHPEDYIAQHHLTNASFVGPAYGKKKLDLFASADIFVLPTAYPTEGQPIAILEAMQFGLPVVTTRQGGISDIICDRRNGALSEPHDPAALLGSTDHLLEPATWGNVSRTNRLTAQALYSADSHGTYMVGLLDASAVEALNRF